MRIENVIWARPSVDDPWRLEPPPPEQTEFYDWPTSHRLFSTDSGTYALGPETVDRWFDGGPWQTVISEPAVHFVDLADREDLPIVVIGNGEGPRAYASETGEEWQAVEVRGLQAAGGRLATFVDVATNGQLVIVVGALGDDAAIWTLRE